MGTTRNALIGLGLAAVVAGGVGTGVVVSHIWDGTRETRKIATPDYLLENYRWFKNQSSAINQAESQIHSMREEISAYKKDFEGITRADWSFDAREELARKESVLRGYISQRNMLTKDYNARSSDVTKQFAEGEKPEELEPFLRNYEPIK